MWTLVLKIPPDRQPHPSLNSYSPRNGAPPSCAIPVPRSHTAAAPNRRSSAALLKQRLFLKTLQHILNTHKEFLNTHWFPHTDLNLSLHNFKASISWSVNSGRGKHLLLIYVISSNNVNIPIIWNDHLSNLKALINLLLVS